MHRGVWFKDGHSEKSIIENETRNKSSLRLYITAQPTPSSSPLKKHVLYLFLITYGVCLYRDGASRGWEVSSGSPYWVYDEFIAPKELLSLSRRSRGSGKDHVPA